MASESFVAPVTFESISLGVFVVFSPVGHAPGSLTRGDHTGCSDSVEQAHCTLGAVKRYRALLEGGGLPNFLFTTSRLFIKQNQLFEATCGLRGRVSMR